MTISYTVALHKAFQNQFLAILTLSPQRSQKAELFKIPLYQKDHSGCTPRVAFQEISLGSQRTRDL